MVPALASALLFVAMVPYGACAGLAYPIHGDLVRGFAPIGQYGGHWGIDIAADVGTIVRSADDGFVSFAGDVAGILSVTVSHGGGLRTSYSYLDSIGVVAGQEVSRLSELGRSGLDHDSPALHFSVRVGDSYQDPLHWLVCWDAPHPALRLVPLPPAYAAERATRHPRRYIRSPSSRSSVCGRSGVPRPGPRRRDIPAGGRPVAKGAARRDIG